ncbi:MAG: hypothetical protein D6706_07090, partial [Chloroflexi bacterium]
INPRPQKASHGAASGGGAEGAEGAEGCFFARKNIFLSGRCKKKFYARARAYKPSALSAHALKPLW